MEASIIIQNLTLKHLLGYTYLKNVKAPVILLVLRKLLYSLQGLNTNFWTYGIMFFIQVVHCRGQKLKLITGLSNRENEVSCIDLKLVLLNNSCSILKAT